MYYQPQNVLVTGGAGFIGSHFIKHLFKKCVYKTLTNVDLLTYAGNTKNVEGLPITNLWYVNIKDDAIADILSTYSIDTVINFAAESHVDRSIRYPKEFLETEIVGLFNLIYWSMKCGVKRFVHIGTDEEYGDKYQGEADETSPLQPNSPYAASKAAASILLQSYIKTYNFPAIIVRPCNNYGPFQYPEKLVPVQITRIMTHKGVLVHGVGEEIREWIYVEDCCDAIYKILLNGSVGEIYNIGSGDRLKNIDVVQTIRTMMGDKKDITFIKNRPGNDKRYAVDRSKSLKLIGYNYSNTQFIDGIAATIKWYMENKQWWKEIDLQSNFYTDEEYLR